MQVSEWSGEKEQLLAELREAKRAAKEREEQLSKECRDNADKVGHCF